MENLVKQLESEGKKILRLQFAGKDILEDIVNGTKTEETRMIYPHNEGKYLVGDGTLTIRHYDYLLLVNGRKDTAPQVLVEVKDAHLFVETETDKDGQEHYVTYKQEGVTYYSIGIAYDLGKIINRKYI